MRNMSFFLTTEAIRNRTKFVTRRLGWGNLKRGDTIRAVKKCMGLKKGEKIEELAIIRIVSVRKEPLNAITHEECVLEGFPNYTPIQFVKMLIDHYGCSEYQIFNRIEFKYLNKEDA